MGEEMEARGKPAITTESELEAVIGAPMEFVRMKVRDRIDDAMRTFIAHSPLVFVLNQTSQIALVWELALTTLPLKLKIMPTISMDENEYCL